MVINSKDEYDNGQEYVHELENKIISYEHIFELIDKLIYEIQFVHTYDYDRAYELDKMLRERFKTMSNVSIFKKDDLSNRMNEWIKQLDVIFQFDPDRVEEITNNFIQRTNMPEEIKSLILNKGNKYGKEK